MSSFRLAHLFLAFLLLFGAQPVHASWSHDPYFPNTLPGWPSVAYYPQAIPDGNGGMYVTVNLRYGTGIYLAHILADGSPDPTWPTPGRHVSTASNYGAVDLTLDRYGAIWLMWDEFGELFVSCVLPNGTLAPGVGLGGLGITGSFPAASSGSARMAVSPYTNDLTVAFGHGVGLNQDIGAVTVRRSPVVSVVHTTLVNCAPAQGYDPQIAINGAGQIGISYYKDTGELWFASISYMSGALVGNFQIAKPASNFHVLYGSSYFFYAAYEQPLSFGKQMVLCVFDADNTYLSSTTPISTGIYSQRPVAIMPRSGGRAWVVWREQYSATGPSSVAVASILNGNINTIRNSQQQIPLDVYEPAVVSDGLDGLLLHGYSDLASGRLVVRIPANGIVPPTWSPFPWYAVFASPNSGYTSFAKLVCPTGDGGAFVWPDDSYGTYMRLDRWGAYQAEPEQLLVKDVVADQGGRVRLSWKGSYLDAGYPLEVSQYRIWRQVAAAGATAALTLDDAPPGDDPQPGEVRWHTAPSGVAAAWEFLGSQPAAGLTEYSFVASTGQDSTSSGSHANEFMVEAVHLAYGGNGITWFSKPASGWSVDNLPPAMPSPFFGTLVVAGTELTWNANAETDLAGYRLHRGTAATFVPGPSNLVAQTTATSVLDAGSSGYWYKLAAVDARGNLSPYAVLSPAGTLDTPGPRTPTTLEFGLVTANPSRGGAGLRLALPTMGHVRVAVYDVRGRQVRVLEDGPREAGEYPLSWDGRDEAGAEVGGGVYFARLVTAGRTLTQRMVRLR